MTSYKDDSKGKEGGITLLHKSMLNLHRNQVHTLTSISDNTFLRPLSEVYQLSKNKYLLNYLYSRYSKNTSLCQPIHIWVSVGGLYSF